MSILNLEHVSKNLGGRVILDEASVGIEAGEKVGIIGVNGTGKSTLLSILAKVMASSLTAAITMTGTLFVPRPRLSPPLLMPPLKKASSTWISPANWYAASRASIAFRILCSIVQAHFRPIPTFRESANAERPRLSVLTK